MGVLDLNGTWKMRWADGQRGRTEFANRDQIDPARYFDAQVPGDVHLDLWRQGIIADPYTGTNCLAARWVEECTWSYRREFEVTAEMLEGRSWLVFDALDLIATIVLNGLAIGSHKNVFYPCRLETTGKLRLGVNVLAVHLESGLFEVADKPAAGWSTQPDAKLHKRHWLRKPQSQFSWDWSTRLINIGITKQVRFEYCQPTARADQLVPLTDLSADLKLGSVRAKWFIEGLAAEAVIGTLTVEIPEAGLKIVGDVNIQPGLHSYEQTVQIDQPKLWWPVGHGDPSRYELKVTLAVSGKIIAEKTVSVGFRHVRINQDKHPESGRYFIFEINGRPIFCKGANFVPADMIFARLDRERYDKLTDLALEANFNFLRVWGGGLYESDDFFDLCDQKGILVWQEFIFACSKYPVIDEEFHNNIKAEAVYNIRRLASHPSLVAWCGNNKMRWRIGIGSTTQAWFFPIIHFFTSRCHSL